MRENLPNPTALPELPLVNTHQGNCYTRKPYLLLCLLLLLFASQWSLAQENAEVHIVSKLTGDTDNPSNGTLEMEEGAIAFSGTLLGDWQPARIRNVVTLSLLEESPIYLANDIEVDMTVEIRYGTSILDYETREQHLQVSYKKAAGEKFNAKQYFSFEGALYVEVEVMDIAVTGMAPEDVVNVLLLENEISIAWAYILDVDAEPSSLTHGTATDDALPVSWEWPAATGNNFTQLEWTWLEDELEDNYKVEDEIDLDLLFRNNATRVELFASQTSYDIPLFYDGEGKLYYRIRPVLRQAGISREGEWNNAAAAFSFEGHNNDLNWQVTTSFAEEGKRKTVMQYYDGSLRNRQTVTKDNLTNTTVIAETFYDAQGRPAVQVLPTPGIASVIAYTKNLNLFNTQVADEDPLDLFDLVPVASPNDAVPALQTISGAARYYSDDNDELSINPLADHIPDAEGYPYALTRYTPDATGRVLSQSGVGKAFQMGGGHETKYYYGSPSQEELDGLFGTEVGNFTHYFKNMVKDANGQMSVSYVDMHGRTIATALAGAAPANLLALNNDNNTVYPNQAGSVINRKLLDKNTNLVKGNYIESINTLLVPAPATYTFEYQLGPDALPLPTCSLGTRCYDCMYNLEFSITDESGDVAPIVIRYNNISANPDDDCVTDEPVFRDESGAAVIDNTISFPLELEPGSYLVRKTLTVSEASLLHYKQEYLQKALCKTEQEIIDSIYSVLVTESGCDEEPVLAPCEQCQEDLGDSTSFREAYIANIGTITGDSLALEAEIRAAFAQAQLHCQRLCNQVSQVLAGKRQLMLSDMMPYTGQYAFDSIPVGMVPLQLYHKYNIFSTNTPSTQPFYKKPWNSEQDPGFYYTPLNSVDRSIHPGGDEDDYSYLNSTSKESFTSLFKNNWAEALLPHHPEYPKLQFAETNLAESYNWIHRFTHVETYQQAVDSGFIFTSSLDIIDPFYTEAPSYKSAMVTKISDDYLNDLSMWQIAYGEVKCKNIIDEGDRDNCYQSAPAIPPYSDLTTAEKNRAWLVFRNLYANERDVQVNDYIDASVALTDADDLVENNYILRFPASNEVMAQQYGWDWYPAAYGEMPDTSGLTGANNPAEIYAGRCSSYINQWRQALLQCDSLNNHEDKDAIIAAILEGMVAVCEKGSDGANPYGSSSVAPTTPVDGSPRNFEQVIYQVFDEYNIPRSTFCNAYTIEFPKPYGKGQELTAAVTTVVDSCHCDQYAQLINSAAHAGYNINILDSINAYLNWIYQDTLTVALYEALLHCSELEESLYPYSLPLPAPLPAFLQCGYTDPYKCLSCDQLSALTDAFKDTFNVALNTGPYYPYNTGPVLYDSPLSEADIAHNVLYAQFLNYRTGLQFSWMEYALAADSAGCSLAQYKGNLGGATDYLAVDSRDDNAPYEYTATDSIVLQDGFESGLQDQFIAYISSGEAATQTVACINPHPLSDTSGWVPPYSPCQRVMNMSIAIGQAIYRQRIQRLLADFEAQYRSRCLAAGERESFTVSYTNSEYHYTLYYYDQAGNLVKTVPPKGVHPDFSEEFLEDVAEAREEDGFEVPAHTFITQYRYNSLNKLIAQHTPDAGLSEFWYDRLGRLVVSRNAQQDADNKYSYTLYDALGRIVEVGQKPHTGGMNQTISQDPEELLTWIESTTGGGSEREQITYTGYDLPYGSGLYPDGILAHEGYLNQRNLRNRVSYSAVKDGETDEDNQAATFYTYDIHGNVDTLLQDYEGVAVMQANDNRYKLIAYNYDLVSGKVNGVDYQPGKWDAFYHRYQYDAENRITAVLTSRDSIVWEQEANYTYYKHGPLARSTIGQLQVQGMDYAYTLQGWLKGVNSTSVGDGTKDMGLDGTGSSVVARDVLGFALHYYDDADEEEDYKAIGGTNAFARPANDAFKSLYNGNIGAMSVNNAGLQRASSGVNDLPLFYNYRYDQLNRLVSMRAYKGLDNGDNIWEPVSIEDYKEDISYDPNGNIVAYQRNGAPEAGGQETMDDLGYEYYTDKNRLKKVTDAVSNGNYADDIDNQNEEENYIYDAIGNLTEDKAEDIEITWTVYGKIKTVIKNSGTVTYEYDAAGNRISKEYDGKTTVYVRDATGNVMSVYEKETMGALEQAELHLYGSNRLGMLTKRTVMPTDNISLDNWETTGTLFTFTRGEKIFELSNHLGNVLTTVNDKKLAHDGGGGEIDYYEADVVTATDYYPFGSIMPGRKYAADGSYRYGFNGKENDNEVKSEGNQQDYGLRIYDPRLGKFLSVDPLTNAYPYLTPYQFAANRPIVAVDIDGAEPEDTNEQIKESDVPTEKHEKPGILEGAWKMFTGNTHQVAAKAFAASREEMPDVVGVVTFNADEYNTIAITYTRYNAIVVQPDGTNTYEKRINVTYSVFSASNFLGFDKSKTDLSEEEFFSKDKNELLGPTVISPPIPGSPGGGKTIDRIIKAGAKLGKLGAFRYAAKYGIQAYDKLKSVVTEAGIEVHHLIEKRFAKTLGENAGKMSSIVLTKAEHIKFTTMWRLEIGYSNSRKLINTTTATKEQINAAAKNIYKDYPEILEALGL